MVFNTSVLDSVNQTFINANLSTDINSLLLSKQIVNDVETITLVKQIEAKVKAEYKLPTWFKTDKIYYPDKLNVEQTSSEVSALYKSKLVSGDTLLDATAGFGVDIYFFSKKIKHITACETNAELVKITRHNFEQLQVQNVTILHQDGIDFLKASDIIYDWIYIDPSRRNNIKGKVFRFIDSEPNILEHLRLFFKRSKNVLIKSSPLIDLSLGIKELGNVSEIHVVAIENEVKELLWILRENKGSTTLIKTANLIKNGVEKFDFVFEDEKKAKAEFALPKKYLHEPNAAILKSGAFKLLSEKLNVSKLHLHAHLYTSQKKINFPGRSFSILDSFEFNKKRIKKILPKKANITIRNFPMSVSKLRTEFKIADGGNLYLFFTTNMENKKIVIFCEKI